MTDKLEKAIEEILDQVGFPIIRDEKGEHKYHVRKKVEKDILSLCKLEYKRGYIFGYVDRELGFKPEIKIPKQTKQNIKGQH